MQTYTLQRRGFRHRIARPFHAEVTEALQDPRLRASAIRIRRTGLGIAQPIAELDALVLALGGNIGVPAVFLLVLGEQLQLLFVRLRDGAHGSTVGIGQLARPQVAPVMVQPANVHVRPPTTPVSNHGKVGAGASGGYLSLLDANSRLQ